MHRHMSRLFVGVSRKLQKMGISFSMWTASACKFDQNGGCFNGKISCFTFSHSFPFSIEVSRKAILGEVSGRGMNPAYQQKLLQDSIENGVLSDLPEPREGRPGGMYLFLVLTKLRFYCCFCFMSKLIC